MIAGKRGQVRLAAARRPTWTRGRAGNVNSKTTSDKLPVKEETLQSPPEITTREQPEEKVEDDIRSQGETKNGMGMENKQEKLEEENEESRREVSTTKHCIRADEAPSPVPIKSKVMGLDRLEDQ